MHLQAHPVSLTCSLVTERVPEMLNLTLGPKLDTQCQFWALFWVNFGPYTPLLLALPCIIQRVPINMKIQ